MDERSVRLPQSAFGAGSPRGAASIANAGAVVNTAVQLRNATCHVPRCMADGRQDGAPVRREELGTVANTCRRPRSSRQAPSLGIHSHTSARQKVSVSSRSSTAPQEGHMRQRPRLAPTHACPYLLYAIMQTERRETQRDPRAALGASTGSGGSDRAGDRQPVRGASMFAALVKGPARLGGGSISTRKDFHWIHFPSCGTRKSVLNRYPDGANATLSHQSQLGTRRQMASGKALAHPVHFPGFSDTQVRLYSFEQHYYMLDRDMTRDRSLQSGPICCHPPHPCMRRAQLARRSLLRSVSPWLG
jgi:hypothetical protein